VVDHGRSLKDVAFCGFNAVYSYQPNASDSLYNAVAAERLWLFQGIWFHNSPEDFHAEDNKNQVRAGIRTAIDAVHASSVEDRIVAYILFGEPDPASVTATNALHPGPVSYTGPYVQAVSVSATEAFFAEMADYTKQYEQDQYGERHLVSVVNWPPTDSFGPEPTLNLDFLDFVTYTIYPYWPPEVSAHAPGSSTGTPFQGYVEELKQHHPQTPVLIIETGQSTSPRPLPTDTVIVPPTYGYGGADESTQARAIRDRWTDIHTASADLAGWFVFEWNDEWWKNAGPIPDDPGSDRFSHNPNDPEEWFGLIGIDGTSPQDYRVWRKQAYWEVFSFWGNPAVTVIDFCDRADPATGYSIYNPRPGENALTLSADSTDRAEGEASLSLDYHLAGSIPPASTYVVLQPFYVPETGFDWSRFDGLSVFVRTVTQQTGVILRIQLFDEATPGGPQEGWIHDLTTPQAATDFEEMRIPFSSFENPAFFPDNNGRLDSDRVRRVEFALVSTAPHDTAKEGKLLLDFIRVYSNTAGTGGWLLY